ncbi:SDR family oxidoreductase [Glaciihabitans sp. dw_435]|uniref:SDR family oxidoreductase n=1 Tax=Glaciihabitans sp. dw_435 TaxID=2720081 RepID=UPI001BD300BE|nr:SDR family oxidoreductase [Glaciihabitans sp. dw_435]
MPKKAPVIVITGASSGIGRATSLRFARRGANLVLASRDRAALEMLADECVRLGADAIAVPTDVTSNDDVEALGRIAVGSFGQIDVWVNGAGIGLFATVDTAPLDEFRRVLDVNIMGVVHGSRVALKVMKKQKRGTIINIGSIIGEIATPYTSAYGMSKAAVRSLGVAIGRELKIEGFRRVRISTILPPTIDTPFFAHAANYSGRTARAIPPVYPPELIAKTIERMAKSPRPEIVVGFLGRAFTRQHRLAPRIVEAEMSALVNVTQRPHRSHAEDTSGAVFEPELGEDKTVNGGWHGAARYRGRKLLVLTAVVAATTVLVRWGRR